MNKNKYRGLLKFTTLFILLASCISETQWNNFLCSRGGLFPSHSIPNALEGQQNKTDVTGKKLKNYLLKIKDDVLCKFIVRLVEVSKAYPENNGPSIMRSYHQITSECFPAKMQCLIEKIVDKMFPHPKPEDEDGEKEREKLKLQVAEFIGQQAIKGSHNMLQLISIAHLHNFKPLNKDSQLAELGEGIYIGFLSLMPILYNELLREKLGSDCNFFSTKYQELTQDLCKEINDAVENKNPIEFTETERFFKNNKILFGCACFLNPTTLLEELNLAFQKHKQDRIDPIYDEKIDKMIPEIKDYIQNNNNNIQAKTHDIKKHRIKNNIHKIGNRILIPMIIAAIIGTIIYIEKKELKDLQKQNKKNLKEKGNYAWITDELEEITE
jgi:hypothetical protein